MPLSDVSLIVTAGHRTGYLRQCLAGIGRFLRECTTIVVNDDGARPKTPLGIDLYGWTVWDEVPRDTFLTKKRNLAVSLIDTKYAVLLADDYVIDADTRRVLIKMTNILDKYTLPDVIGGNFRGVAYEGFLKIVEGEYIQAVPLDTKSHPLIKGRTKLWQVDMTANFFMARTAVLRDVPWDETIGPIGGEHADWFLDMKAAGKVVVWTEGLNIDEQEKDATKEAPYYGTMRRRAWDGHALMLKKRGVKRYVSFGETP